jgi:hypothetical protein
MILASRKFVRAVSEAWFSSTVEKDDVKIIKMFYDIPGTVYGTIRRHDTICTIAYHTIPDPKSRDRSILFSLFLMYLLQYLLF